MAKAAKKKNAGGKKVAFKKSNASSCASSKKNGPGGVQNILNFALFFEQSLGTHDVPRKRLMTMSGVKSNTFTVTLCNMRKKGLIEYNKNTVQLTEIGRARADQVTNLPMDNASAQQDLKTRFKIGGKAAVLFDQLSDGVIHDRKAIIGALGLKSKNSAAVMLCNLRKNGIIDYDKTTIKLTDICFPFGRPGDSVE